MDPSTRAPSSCLRAPSPGRVLGRVRGAAIVALAVLAMLAVVPADPAQAQTPAEQARANSLYKEAKELFEANDFDKALEIVTEAERIFGHPSITFLKGRTLRKLGRLREAEKSLKQADTAQLPKALQKPLAEERLALSEELRVKGHLTVKVQPPNAVVSVDGEPSKGGYDRWLLAGKRRVEVAAPDYRPVVRVVEVMAGETAELKINLTPLGGTLAVVVPGGLRGVEILVDGVAVEVPQGSDVGDRLPAVPVAIGNHEIVCAKGERRVTRIVRVDVDASVDVECPDLHPEAGVPAQKVVGWSGVAAGAALLGYGAYGLGSYVLVDLDDPRGISSTNKHWLGTVYTVSGIATGVLSYLFFVRDADGDKKTAAYPVADGVDTAAGSGLPVVPVAGPVGIPAASR